MKKIFNRKINKYCLALSLVFIFSGCSSPSKKNQLLSLQQRRIKKLEHQLKKKDRQIQKLKTSRWVNKPIRKDETLAFKPLRQLIRQKNWPRALQVSSELKKQYSSSAQLRIYRYQIFSKMGLLEQANQEKRMARKLITSHNKKGPVKKNAL